MHDAHKAIRRPSLSIDFSSKRIISISLLSSEMAFPFNNGQRLGSACGAIAEDFQHSSGL
jgi:hypothetical protein